MMIRLDLQSVSLFKDSTLKLDVLKVFILLKDVYAV